ncbi:MAG: bifunctional DNA-formamidopyrimidine glycosylase/DNA-(apurinic or apyrimidinic site) lyase [Myxococcales bacterium]|nr:bifunctional DNA-formamidopyrimidine glycosylase/DNA-(apurinic or apyrimidinic site) lyase [Myxococcales bacterium]
MPELPEVETVRRTLAPALGMRVDAVFASGQALRGKAVRRAELTPLIGAALRAIDRRGKYLVLQFGARAIIAHLGMSGRLLWSAASVPRPKHTHAVLADGCGHELRFVDPRRFGQFEVVMTPALAAHPSLAPLGVDPIAEGLAGAQLAALARARRTPIKSLLLDQAALAGVGNIYASEALWLAKVHPLRAANRLSAHAYDEVAHGVVQVMRDAIENHGTSLRDFVSGTGEAGGNAGYLQVYGRAGKPCLRCGVAIKSFVVAGRNTYCCPRCQPAPRRGKVTTL